MTLHFKLLLVGLSVLAACNTAVDKDKNTTPSPAPAATAIMPADSTKTFDVALVDNKKDPSCGMPVTAGVSDTLHYKGKVLGFCSTECKDSFVKDPITAFAAIEFKK